MHRSITCRSLALAALLAAIGCGPPPTVADTDGTFHDSLRTYANLVRWGEFHSASRFYRDEGRDDFLALEPDLERLRFTDFDMGPVRYGRDGDTEEGQYAVVRVVYHAYDVRTLVEQRIVDEQVWRSEGARSWSVESDLSSFQKALGLPVPVPQPPAQRAPGSDPAGGL